MYLLHLVRHPFLLLRAWKRSQNCLVYNPQGISLIPQYAYGGATSHMPLQQQDIHHTTPEGHAVPFTPHLFYPPMLVPIYPFGLASRPVGNQSIFTPNVAAYPAQPDNLVSSPIRTNTPSRTSDPHPSPPRERPPSQPGSFNGPSIFSLTTIGQAPSAHQKTPSSPIVPSSSGTPPPRRTTGRYGINELLNCQLDNYPYIDWVIYDDLSLARQWVIGHSGKERCQSMSFERLAVLPPVNDLCIRTTGRGQYTPVGKAIQRWGDIRVRRFDRFLSVGDVLHEIWAYFYAPLTEEEKVSMQPPFSRRVEECFQERWNAQGRLTEQAVKRRCDALLDCVRFAGLEIDLDFEKNRLLYLSLEDVNVTRA